MATAPEPVGDGLVVVGDPDRSVDHEQDDVGVAHRGLDLARHLGIERRPGTARHPAAGVDDAERHAEPVRLEDLAITGDPGAILHDRRLLADDAVEQRRLADVRPADDGDERQLLSDHHGSVPRGRHEGRGRRWQ